MKAPRVTIFSTAYFPLVGGAEVAMKEVTDRLPNWEFDLYCARIQPGLADTEKIGNVTVHRCGFGKPIDKMLLPVIGTWKAYWATRQEKQPLIWSLMASQGGFAALTYTWLRPRARMLLTLQEGDPLEHYDKRTGVLTFVHKMIFRRANHVQAISTFLANWAKRMGFCGEPQIIPNGVDIEKFARRISLEDRQKFRQQYGYAESDVVIVTASRLSLKNAVDDMIRALVELPESYKVLVAGIGEDEPMLHALVASLHVESRVTFLGKKSHDELPMILQSSDLFCRPSLSEGLGNSFLEAMAAGIPIIGTPVGGIPDFLIDGETGVFCQPRDPASLARAAMRIQTEPGLRERLITQGEKRVREGFAWQGIAQRIDAMLRALASG